jgi:hypothetical protein
VNWNRWNYRVDAPTGGVVILPHPNLKQWRAYVDDQPTDLLTANAVFAAVIVEPGKHDIRLVFESKPAKLGAAAFFACAAISVALFFWPRRGGRATRRWISRGLVVLGLVGVGLVALAWFKGTTTDLDVSTLVKKT